MNKRTALFNLLKDGDWHSHIECRDVGGTEFAARFTELRQILGEKYEIAKKHIQGSEYHYRLQPAGQDIKQPVAPKYEDPDQNYWSRLAREADDPTLRPDYQRMVEKGRAIIKAYRERKTP